MALKEYKCPNCGGSIAFDSDSQKLKCNHCSNTYDFAEIEQYQNTLAQADDIEINVTQDNFFDEHEAVGMSVFTCQSCGGEIVQEESAIAGSCPFCGNAIVNTGKVEGRLKPDLIIPFKLDKESAKEAYLKHVDQKYVPRIFKDTSHIEEIRGVYVPFWLFDADVEADMSFSAAEVRSYLEGDYEVTETDHYRLLRSGQMAFKSLPANASSKIDSVLMESIEPFDVQEAESFNSSYLAGFLANSYDIGLADVSDRAKQRIRYSVENTLYQTTVHYDMVSKEHSAIRTNNLISHYALFPVWLLLTKYKGKDYLFAMNGQNGRLVGDLPTDNAIMLKDFLKKFFLMLIFIFILMMALQYLIWWGEMQ